MKKNFTSIFLAILISLLVQVSVVATEQSKDNIKVQLNNDKVIFNEKVGFPFLDGNNRVQTPFRVILEMFGAKVTWNENEKMAIAQKGDIIVKVPIGKKYIYRNSDVIINDTNSMLINGRTYLPIRAVMESFGCDVNWSEKEKVIYISNTNNDTTINKIPSKYDLRKFNKLTPVKDQKEIGACWAFATLGSIESVLMPSKAFDLSEDHLSLGHGYNVSQNKGGDFNIAMSYLARWDGPVLEVDDPYGDGKMNATAKVVKHVQEAKVLPSKDYSAIKLSLLLYGGVQSAMYFDESLTKGNNTIYNNETYSFYYKGNAKFNHAVVIVGWDDNYPKGNFSTQPEANGAFICKNSYGKDFGDDGYFYVSYFDKHIGTENVVYSRVDNISNYSRIYQTDYLGWVGRLGYGTDSAYFANAYDIKDKKENLRAVSFYATDKNTKYEVYVVKKFKTTSDFKNMTLVKKGSLDYEGYYTIDFDSPILIENKFAVVVKITTAGSSLPVAAEYYKKVDWLDKVIISDGEGYMSQHGTSWDSTENIFDSNVCLKAFTSTIE
ncbi:MAG: peptidase C1 [Firmicutes bacterium HGW-Firmicutes-1]|nr:MAG: peptidase C1 [Firmicutes bacterium HGW-Firmicutes-1]